MGRFNKSIFLGTIMILLLWNISYADDIKLERIVVTPSRIEQSAGDTSRKVDIVTSKDIESSSANDLSELLTETTSVNISNYGGLGASKTIRMRGSTAAQTLVLLDGRPLNSPRSGEVDLSNIPLDNIDRVEVMHGPASSLYGSQAMAGTINIISRRPPKEKQKTEIISTFGTFRTYNEKLIHGARISKFGYLISGGYQRSEGFRDNSEFHSKDSNLRLEYEANGNNNFTLTSGFYKSKLGAPGTITSFDNDDKQMNMNKFADLRWRLKPDESLEFKTKVYRTYDRLEFMENTAGSVFDTALSKNIHTTTVNGLDVQINKEILSNYTLLGGFNYVGNFNDSTTSFKHEYTVRAGYLSNELQLWERLNLSFGARFDDYSNFGTQTNPSFSFLYKVDPDNKLHGLISRSFRAPTFNDLYWPDEGWIKGNPNLKPEKGITGEFGIESKISRRITTDVTYYRNDYNQLIQWAEENAVWQPTNVGSTVTDGIEWENKVILFKTLEMNMDYTFQRAKDDKTHKYLIYQPKHKVDLSLVYRPDKTIMLELQGQFTDKRFHDANNTIKVRRFFTLGLNASKKLKHGFTYFISIDNMLDNDYQVIKDYPVPRFSLTSGLKTEF